MVTEFVDELPPSGGRRSAEDRELLTRFAADLKANPGRWAPYPLPQSHQGARACGSRISHGRMKTFPAGFEAVTRRKVLYVRYVGK